MPTPGPAVPRSRRLQGINDRLGHHVGDALLQRFAQVLSAEVRPGTWWRAWPATSSPSYCPPCASRSWSCPPCASGCWRPWRFLGTWPVIGCPLPAAWGGALCHSGQYCHIDDLLHRADAAMYQAKQAGKGASPSISDRASQNAKRRRGPPFFMREGIGCRPAGRGPARFRSCR